MVTVFTLLECLFSRKRKDKIVSEDHLDDTEV